MRCNLHVHIWHSGALVAARGCVVPLMITDNHAVGCHFARWWMARYVLHGSPKGVAAHLAPVAV